jgi:hypothetical protein
MDQVIVISWGFIHFLLCPLLFFSFFFLFFFFFSFLFFTFFLFFIFFFYFRIQQYLLAKNTKGTKSQSPVDPINYRVITTNTWHTSHFPTSSLVTSASHIALKPLASEYFTLAFHKSPKLRTFKLLYLSGSTWYIFQKLRW